ncbi:lytic murein transglycosylase [Falsirhodobacter halotolerans]|uniref:lytic murein transglycosylase n=1 Tax=Falsirhodobacter halotolerans TaxID=1146892 RepID=UPI001FD3B395|nr:lytic murein transglycosylase [Falsirhodobacter halotolerans]MCJ8141085.1 lytic murein transglycosylase [Falsirhodobacter halotolerans]
MIIHRRSFTLGIGALGLAACARGGTVSSGPASIPDDLRPVPDAGYDAWVAAFRPRAVARGISQSTFDAAFRQAGFLPGVITRDRSQPESARSLEDYLSIAVSDERVAKGRAAYARHRALLSALEARYGVDATIITAVWGLESFYGERRGDIPVISATSTLAYDGRRGQFFESQLIAALRVLQNGDVSAQGMTGSWAGAMGHTQFIPTSYLAYAVDYNGDGRRDIWSDDPTDSLASTAAYLARSGWTRGTRWGAEVTGAAPGGTVIQPQAGGPRFAVTGNFRAIKRYNNSDSYAIGVGHLADRIGGGGPLRGTFPPDANGLTKADRVRLQQRLTARGFDTGGADGVLGNKSKAAIRAFQANIGQPATGVPSQALLQALG